MKTDINMRMTLNILIWRCRRWCSLRRGSIFGCRIWCCVDKGCWIVKTGCFESPVDNLVEWLRPFELVFVSSVAFTFNVDESSLWRFLDFGFLWSPGTWRRFQISFAMIVLSHTKAMKMGRKVNENTMMLTFSSCEGIENEKFKATVSCSHG